MVEPNKPSPRKKTAVATSTTAAVAAAELSATTHKEEAKSRFNSALEEAKAGAAALKAEAADKAAAMKLQAKDRSQDWVTEAKSYGEQAKGKAGELAVEGKTKASDALSSLGNVVAENAATIDEKFGSQYGDYARKASRSLHEASAKLDNKSVDELGEDAREFVRKSPGLAVGLAAVAGYMIARVLRSNRGE